MPDTICDRRTRRTRARIRAALVECLKEKELNKVTASRVAQLADVSRGTFYLHYKDVYDLFRQTEEEVVRDMMDIIRGGRASEKRDMMPLFITIFDYIASHVDLCTALLKEDSTAFLTRLIELARPADDSEWALFLGNLTCDREYAYAFVTRGCVGLILHWFEGGLKESPQTVAEIAGRFIQGCADKGE